VRQIRHEPLSVSTLLLDVVGMLEPKGGGLLSPLVKRGVDGRVAIP